MAGEQFYGTPTGPTQRGLDFVYNGGGPLQLAERLAARNTRNNLDQERLRLKASAARAKQNASDQDKFDKLTGYDAGDYGDFLKDGYNSTIDKYRKKYNEGNFNAADLRSDLTPYQNQATILKNLTDQKKTLATGLNSESYIDPGTYNLEFDKAVRAANAAGQPIDANAIHEQVMQNADLIYGNKIANKLIADTPRVKQKVAFDVIDPTTGLKTSQTREVDVPTYARLDNNKITGYDTPSILKTYTADPRGQKRFDLLLQKQMADPNSNYNQEQARIDALNASGKLRGNEYQDLTERNKFNVISKDFGNLADRYGSDIASITDKESLNADQKEAIQTRGYTEDFATLYKPKGGADIKVPSLTFQLSPKEKMNASVNTVGGFKEGINGQLINTDQSDLTNESIAAQGFSVTTVPRFNQIQGNQLYAKDGKPILAKGKIPTIEDIDLAAAGDGNVYFKRKDGKMVYLPKDKFLNSSYVQFPLYARVDLQGKDSESSGSFGNAVQTKKAKGNYILPLNANSNSLLLKMAIDKGGFQNADELKRKISDMARKGLLSQKIKKEDTGEF